MRGRPRSVARASLLLLLALGLLLVPGPPTGARLARAEPRKRRGNGQGGPERCVVVLGTGRSGSTSLVDALNQMPHFFVRMEQEGAYWYLYLAWSHSKDFASSVRRVEGSAGPTAAAHLSYRAAKGIYDNFAVRKKIPWFNDLHPVRMREAVRAFYTITYGYHGPGIVSGFKEVRFVRGRAFSSDSSTYKDFEDFIAFLRLLRASASLEDNYKLESMLSRNGVLKTTSNETFLNDLTTTHQWFDRYAEEHPDHAFRVIMEDMFNPERNRTLVRDMLTFLGESPDTFRDVIFNRMPTWMSSLFGNLFNGKSGSESGGAGLFSSANKFKSDEPAAPVAVVDAVPAKGKAASKKGGKEDKAPAKGGHAAAGTSAAAAAPKAQATPRGPSWWVPAGVKRLFASFGTIESVRMRAVPVKVDAAMPRRSAILSGAVDTERGLPCTAYVVFKEEVSARAALTANMQTSDEDLIGFVLGKAADHPELADSVEAVRVVRDRATNVGKGIQTKGKVRAVLGKERKGGEEKQRSEKRPALRLACLPKRGARWKLPTTFVSTNASKYNLGIRRR
eukprot:XP_001697851.1 predicted protein [Chlamydomonas reinhardtii]